MEIAPLAKIDGLDTDEEEDDDLQVTKEPKENVKCDFMGNNIYEADKIPYKAVYENRDEIRRRGYFIPAFPIIAKIIHVEKDRRGVLPLYSPYVYTIDLTHGPFEWTIKRRYIDFQRLNNALKIYHASTFILSPFRKSSPDEFVLPYTTAGNLVELSQLDFTHFITATEQTIQIAQMEPAFRKEPENVPLIKPTKILNLTTKESEKLHSRRKFDKINSAVIDKNLKISKRRDVLNMEKPDFPNVPDLFISEDKVEERKTRFQDYLSQILENRGYRDHPEMARFLEVSRLSFVYKLGTKNKEGMVEERPDGCKFLGEARNCCLAYCVNWRNTWLTIKDSFVAHLDHKTESIRDIILFDRDFDVYTKSEYPGDQSEAVRKGLFITNGYDDLMLKCDSLQEAIDWKNEIDNIILNKGSIWCDEHRFASSYPIRENSFAQWLIDGKSHMNHLANMLELARDEIFITGWCLNSQIYMKRPIINDRWRLDLILKRKAEEGVRIFILLWKEIARGMPGIGSYETELYLMSLHPNIKVLRHPDLRSNIVLLWSHHEKIIIIDQKIAFVGGIDLCYGRWDDYEHR